MFGFLLAGTNYTGVSHDLIDANDPDEVCLDTDLSDTQTTGY
jgi:hypothetical protein